MYSPDHRAGDEMIERLRALSPPLKYLVYVAGALLVLFVAVGVGATTAVVVDRQFGWVATDSAETGALGGSKAETTDAAKASENTAIEASGDSKHSDDTAYKASFIHRATDENSHGDYTYIGDPSINGRPNAMSGRSSTRIEQRCPQEPPSGWKFRKHPRNSSTTQVL
jgi:hypothetical protein